MNKVRMRHPDLDQEIDVPESAVPIHMGSGWVPADQDDDVTPPAEQPAAKTAETPKTTTRPKTPAAEKE